MIHKIFKNRAVDKQAGFTLIEIIVSLAIFTLVAVVAVGAFLKIVDANKKSQSLKTAINNINFALESMTREMRVGSLYTCFADSVEINNFVQDTDLDGGCTPGVNTAGVAFLSAKALTTGSGAPCNAVHAYYFDDSTTPHTLKKAEQTACGTPMSTSDFAPIISPDAAIDAHDLIVTNQSSVTGPQPSAFVHIRGHSGVQVKNQTYFDVQTTISQRNPF